MKYMTKIGQGRGGEGGGGKGEYHTGFLTTHTRSFLWPEPHLLFIGILPMRYFLFIGIYLHITSLKKKTALGSAHKAENFNFFALL